MIAIDTETCLIMPGILAPPLVCVTWAKRGDDGEMHRGILHRSERAKIVVTLAAAFREDSTFANAPYDLAVLLAFDDRLRMPILEAVNAGRVHDVQTRQKLMDLGDGRFRFEEDEETGETKVVRYSLQDLGTRWGLGGKVHDDWRLRYHELYGVPVDKWPKEAVYYAVRDADLTLRVHEKQEGPNLDDAARHVAAHFALHLASARGLRTDARAVDELENWTRLRMEKLLPELVKEGLARKDGTRSTKAAVRRMIGTGTVTLTETGHQLAMGDEERLEKLPDTAEARAFREEPGTRTFLQLAHAEGKWVSVSKQACFECGDEVLKRYSEFSQMRNLLSGSIKDLRGGVLLPIQSRFDPLKETGRTGSSRPNIQNLRRIPGVRECYVPRDGYLFVAADYSAAELHTLAQSCLDLLGKSRLAEALNADLDPHAWVGSLILGIEYPEMMQRLAAGDAEAAYARQLAKVANFGFPGGCSATTFSAIARAQKVEIDDHEAARLRAIWFRAWPEMEEFFRYVGESTDDRGWNWARLTRSGRMRARCTYTAACNTYFQGPAADGAKTALWDVTKEIWGDDPSPLRGSYLVNFVHDELLLESPEDLAAEAAERLAVVMEDAFNEIVPDVPTTAEPVIMRRWSKKAKTVRDETGRLIPWEHVA